jgi:hypothetical protein
MNSEKLERKLVAVARADVPVDAVPYAFEKRVTARLRGRSNLDAVGFWSRALWRAAIPCLAIPLLVGFWAISPVFTARAEASLSQEFEDSVYASVVQQFVDTEEW